MPASSSTTGPRRPLSDPLWWSALALWLLNDHLFKGSGLLPGALTGKLSDACGLWVLAAGLASLGRDARFRVGAYLAVGLYFIGLQVWPPMRLASEWVLAALGIPSRITPDPSDLWALAVLLPAYLRYRPSLHLELPALQPAPRLALGYALMSVATVATSRVDQPEGAVRTGRIFLYNNTDQEQSITIKEVRKNVDANCFFIQNNPSQHLQDSLFELKETLSIEAQGLVALDVRATTNLQADLLDDAAACQAMLIGGQDREPHLLFWKSEQFPLQRFSQTPDNLKIEGIIALEPQSEDDPESPLVLKHQGEKPIVYPIMKGEPELASPECAPPTPRIDLDWGEPFPKGPHRLDTITPGPDGCIALELSRPSDDEFTTRRYLCVPPERFPFDEGSELIFRSLKGETPVLGENVDGWQISPKALDAKVKFWVIRGQGLPTLDALSFGAQVRDACPYAPNQAGCASLSRPLDIIAKSEPGGMEVLLRARGSDAGEKLPGIDGEWTLELLNGQERSIFDGECSGDRISAGREIQLIATWRRNAT